MNLYPYRKGGGGESLSHAEEGAHKNVFIQ